MVLSEPGLRGFLLSYFPLRSTKIDCCPILQLHLADAYQHYIYACGDQPLALRRITNLKRGKEVVQKTSPS